MTLISRRTAARTRSSLRERVRESKATERESHRERERVREKKKKTYRNIKREKVRERGSEPCGTHQVQSIWCCEPSEYEISQSPDLRKNLSGDGTATMRVSE